MTVPVLRDFPHEFETERLMIRAPRPGDGAAVNAAIVESWPRLQEWMDWAQAPHPPTVAATEARIRHAYAAFIQRTDLQLHCFLRDRETFVAGSGLHRIDWSVPRFEIGYWVRTQFAGQGFVTEAVAGITSFALGVLGARRLEIRCDARNERSAAVARRAGYELEATLRSQARGVDGTLRDTLLFARIVPESSPNE